MFRPLLPLLLLGASVASAEEPARGISATELQIRLHAVAAQAMPACVAIRAADPDRWGSGVLIDREKGWIATSHHGVKGAQTLRVWFPADLEPRVARIVKANASQDVAILSIDPIDLPEAIALPTSPLKTGEWVIAMGYPGGLAAFAEPSLRLGRVADAKRLVTTCRLCPGDSGGPLLTLDGKLAGLHRTADADFTTHVSAAFLEVLKP